MKILLTLGIVGSCFAWVNLRDRHSLLKENRVDGGEQKGHSSADFEYKYVSICVNGSEEGLLTIVHAKECKDGRSRVALGKYSNQVNTTGWGILEIETFASHSYDVQAYAAGVAEGELTRLQIYYHYRNTIETLCNNHTNFCKRLYIYLQEHLDWMRSQVIAKENEGCPYWRHVNLTFAQLTGVYDAYYRRNLTPEIGFDLHPIYMMQLSGEMFDLNKFLNKTPDPLEYPEAGRCSGFVKLAPNNADLFFAHVAMSSLSWMQRIVKIYKFGYDKNEVPGHTVSFSGYPGALVSADDYTLTSAGLSSIETTIAIFDKELYTSKYMKAQGQVHCWVRSFISNALSKTAKGWTDVFSKYNSGTYNNQWTVLDWKHFTPGQPIPDKDMLWILEQAPGHIDSRDMTWYLKRYSYWPSYNIPYLPSISRVAGFDAKARQFKWYEWGGSPRARIFDRDHHKVVDIDSLTKLMRYNDYTNDEFAKCKCTPLPYTGEGGISARGDLNTPNGTYEVESMGFRDHAGLDYKGTNYEMFKKLRFRAWGGPPYDPVPVFDWRTTKLTNIRHFGQPDRWNFTYVDLEWQLPTEVLLKP
ncbi:unnamed protein product [Caenorhabditis auriculariae]|uniref:Phospholipase B-like n=1 Tax=Caenorhabditis auriculariae TaxID=2777116 RepID=A0A8S1GZ39_9PELO|nr:unnamed protein product [Caenorhabditis auriculariae]